MLDAVHEWATYFTFGEVWLRVIEYSTVLWSLTIGSSTIPLFEVIGICGFIIMKPQIIFCHCCCPSSLLHFTTMSEFAKTSNQFGSFCLLTGFLLLRGWTMFLCVEFTHLEVFLRYCLYYAKVVIAGLEASIEDSVSILEFLSDSEFLR